MTHVPYLSLCQAFRERFPEFHAVYAEWDRIWGEGFCDPHIFFGEPDRYIVAHYTNPEAAPLVQRLFAFFEEMANHPDERVRDVVRVTICEYLGYTDEWVRDLRPWMGPAMAALCHRAEMQLRGYDPAETDGPVGGQSAP